MIRGKYVIVAIFAMALAATGFAVWYRYQQSRQAMALWGAEHAGRIRNSATVEVWRLTELPAGKTTESVRAPDGAVVQVAGKRLLENIPDLTYIRRAFLTDAFFQWDAPGQDCVPQWAFAIRFGEGSETTTLWVDKACDRVILAESGAQGTMNAPLLRSVRSFLERYSSEKAPGAKPNAVTRLSPP